jgi:hypothetical protein
VTLLPPGVKVHLAFGCTDMRKGIDGLTMLVQGVLRQDSLFWAPLFVPRSEGQPHQDRFLGWDGLLSVHQAAGARPLPLAGNLRDGWHGDAEFVPALDADRGHRLARARAQMATCRCRMSLQLATD